MRTQPLFDFSDFDLSNIVFDLNDIRRVNPQRHEMEQLSAIVHIDREKHGLVGYKDVTDREFWIAGHMPGFPLMPGVVMCECAAQLAGFYAQKYDMLGGDFLAFGGMDNVRFRKPVVPTCQLVLMARAKRFRYGRRAEFDFQGFVDDHLIFNGTMIGVPINRDQRIHTT